MGEPLDLTGLAAEAVGWRFPEGEAQRTGNKMSVVGTGMVALQSWPC